MSIIHLHDVKVTMITNKTIWYLFLFLTWILLSLTFILLSLLLSRVQPPQVQPSNHGSPCQSQNVVWVVRILQLLLGRVSCPWFWRKSPDLGTLRELQISFEPSHTPWPVMMLEADLLSSPRPSRRSASQTLNSGETLSESDNRLCLELMAQWQMDTSIKHVADTLCFSLECQGEYATLVHDIWYE